MNAYYPDTGGAFLLCKNSYLGGDDAFLRGGSDRAGLEILNKREGEEVVPITEAKNQYNHMKKNRKLLRKDTKCPTHAPR
jgi:hypothetical protein